MIEVEKVTKLFGATRALDSVSLSVGAGRVLALLGPNGAGKTTLVRVLTTLLRPDGGAARVAGLDVTAQARAVRAVIGLAGQYASVDDLLTGRENLELAGLLCHLDKALYRQRARQALDRMSLADAADRPVKTYSGGMRRRLDLGASLIARPPALFPGRAHGRAWPPDPQRPVGPRQRVRRRRHDGAAHDPVHGGSRAPGRFHRRPRCRARRGGGHR